MNKKKYFSNLIKIYQTESKSTIFLAKYFELQLKPQISLFHTKLQKMFGTDDYFFQDFIVIL